jgi:hypothetical protein
VDPSPYEYNGDKDGWAALGYLLDFVTTFGRLQMSTGRMTWLLGMSITVCGMDNNTLKDT